MAIIASNLSLQSFYPVDLEISQIDEREDSIFIHMHSRSKTCICHKRGGLLDKHHSSHRRTVQDLPMLGKRVILDIQIYDYECHSNSYQSFAAAKTFNGFLNYNSRMTNRLEDFACVLATETSCESAARIMNFLNIKISGDTIIRLLLKRYSQQSTEICGTVIGVDDFAFKKRCKYGTIIVDEATHRPVAILNGRDGASLKDWLKENKHITAVTRDRASAYATAIEEILPDCMQIADRFHLHQNLMDAVNKVLGRKVPSTNAIPINKTVLANDAADTDIQEDTEKKESPINKLSEAETKRKGLIVQIQELYTSWISICEISRIIGKDRKTVRKYIKGNSDNLCRSNKHNKHGCLERYTEFIIESIQKGLTQSTIIEELITLGYTQTSSNARKYICTVALQQGLHISKYSNVPNGYKADSTYITRKNIFNSLWLNMKLEQSQHEYLWNQLPVLQEVEQCIRAFRGIFEKKSMPQLYLFIERYKISGIKEIVSFAKGLEKDIYAVENAVASNLSNGFVEGTNSKLKMVKRTMYGRCSKELLEAKLMYRGVAKY